MKSFTKNILSLAVAFVALLSTNKAQADAVFILDTYNENTAFGLVTYNSTPLSGSFKGQVYGSYTSSDATTFVALGSVETFSIGYLYNANPVNVVGASAGQTLFYQIRAWSSASGSTFEQASSNGSAVLGKSSVSSVTLASNLDSFAQQTANNFSSFSLAAVPEPTTIALGVAGGLALLARRRRNA